MCGRITLTRPNLESIAGELNIAPENRGYPSFALFRRVKRFEDVPLGNRSIGPRDFVNGLLHQGTA